MLDEVKIGEFRSVLVSQRENLRKEIVEQGGDPDSDDVEIDVERNFADSGHSTAERARVISVVKALRANLGFVDRALGKIDRGGAYGTCERCGREIAVERLEALPWAILCMECKRQGES